jgi:hypothetical protein
LEMDMIGKYVQRILQLQGEPQPGQGEVNRRRAERIRQTRRADTGEGPR